MSMSYLDVWHTKGVNHSSILDVLHKKLCFQVRIEVRDNTFMPYAKSTSMMIMFFPILSIC